jgi:hypothetical protein
MVKIGHISRTFGILCGGNEKGSHFHTRERSTSTEKTENADIMRKD